MYYLVCGVAPFAVGKQARLEGARPHGVPPPPNSGDALLDAAILRGLALAAGDRPDSARGMMELARPAVPAAVAVANAGVGHAAVDDEPPCESPGLFVRPLDSIELEETQTLELGLANTGAAALECHVTAEAVDPAAVSFPTPDRRVAIPAGQSAWAILSLRVHEPGRHEIRLRVCVRRAGEDAPVSGWEVPGGGLFLDVSRYGTASESGLRVAAPARVAGLSDVVRRAQSQLARGIGGLSVRLDPVVLRPTTPARGVMRPRAGQLRTRHLIVDVHLEDALARRVHILFRHEVRFGRVMRLPGAAEHPARCNHLVLTHLPRGESACDERTRMVSRRAGVLDLTENGCFVRSTSHGICIGEDTLQPGYSQRLSSARSQVVTVGGLELNVRPFRAPRSAQQLCRLVLERPFDSVLHSGSVASVVQHHAVRLGRRANVPFVEYAVAAPWISIGGAAEDVCCVAGLPSRLLWIVRGDAGVYALTSVGSARGPYQHGMWGAVVGGDVVTTGEWRLTLRPGSPALMGEGNLLGAKIVAPGDATDLGEGGR